MMVNAEINTRRLDLSPLDIVTALNFGKTNCFFGVSGDDVFMICPDKYGELVREIILRETARSKQHVGAIGTGQIIKEVYLKPGIDIDFCSKAIKRVGKRWIYSKNLKNV